MLLRLSCCSFAMLLASLAAPHQAHAGNLLFVSDTMTDTNIPMALMADGHTVTTVTNDFAAGNAALRASLASYDAVYWSATGGGFGSTHTNAAVFTNLTTYVMGGGKVFVTGYDSIASPTDAMLISFIGATTSRDVPPAAGVLTMTSNSLTTGIVDIRGVTPTGGYSDRDAARGLVAGTIAVEGSATEAQWTLRPLGMGEVAYVSNGQFGAASAHASWTNTAAGGAGAYNAALRNFAGAAFETMPCVGLMDGSACTSSAGVSGICRASVCCTGCFDGMRCQTGRRTGECGGGGVMCASCDDMDACTTDVCAMGVCTNPNAPMGTSCDDTLFCTATDTCDGSGNCTGAGDPCDDTESCTTDTCDDTADMCMNAALADGTTCTLPTGPGMCQSGVCCGGCFDARTGACVAGTNVRSCGGAGGRCVDCADGNFCTRETCTAGACVYTDNPAGTVCDDGMFCTGPDTCDGMGTCMGGSMACDDGLACTMDTCDEAMDACTATVTAGCVIGGACLTMGDPNPADPCEICNPTADPMDWSMAPMGTNCGASSCESGSLTAMQCDAAGACMRQSVACETGRCADATSCEVMCTAGTCGAGEYCNTLVGTCQPTIPDGTACADAVSCTSGFCVDRVCCDAACDGACEACSVAGVCTPYMAGSDPEDECGASSCDGAGACEGGATDGGVGGDAAITPPPPLGRGGDDGCGCRVAGSPSPTPWAGLLALCLAGALLRRRRRT